jgi:outer membrane autotransporter protein
VDEQEVDSAQTSLGLRLSGEQKMEEGVLIRPRFKLLWNHEWADVDREVSGTFVSAPTTGTTPFTVEGAEMPRDHAEIGLGWEVGFAANANLFLDWQGRFGEDFVENAISFGGRVVW